MNKKFAALGALAGIVTAGAAISQANAGVLLPAESQSFSVNYGRTLTYSEGSPEAFFSGSPNTTQSFELFDPDQGTLVGVTIAIKFGGGHGVAATEIFDEGGNIEPSLTADQDASLSFSLSSGPFATFSALEASIFCSAAEIAETCNKSDGQTLSGDESFNIFDLTAFTGAAGPGAPGTFDLDIELVTPTSTGSNGSIFGLVDYTAAARGDVTVQYEYEIAHTQIAEPGSIALLGLGLVGLGAATRKRRR